MRYLILALLVLTGCANLPKNVRENIHEGDSTDKLIALIGYLNSQGPSQRTPGADAWFYFNAQKDSCGFTVKDKTITYIACHEYTWAEGLAEGTVAMSRGMQASGQALMNQTPPPPIQSPLQCTPNQPGYSGTTYTCQ